MIEKRQSPSDAELIRLALSRHPAPARGKRGSTGKRLADLLGVDRATVHRAATGKTVYLTSKARGRLLEHVDAPEQHPLPEHGVPGSPKAPDARRRSPASANTVRIWLTSAEYAAWWRHRDRCGYVSLAAAMADALAAYAAKPGQPSPRPPGATVAYKWIGRDALRALDAATGDPERRAEHARAALLRAMGEKGQASSILVAPSPDVS